MDRLRELFRYETLIHEAESKILSADLKKVFRYAN